MHIGRQECTIARMDKNYIYIHEFHIRVPCVASFRVVALATWASAGNRAATTANAATPKQLVQLKKRCRAVDSKDVHVYMY